MLHLPAPAHAPRFFRLHAEGRGRFYTKLRGATESVLRVAYRGDWPARVWGRLPGRCAVTVRHARLSVLRDHDRRDARNARGARGVRLGFVSDLHLGPTTPVALLEAAFSALREARPDVLLLGGDYVFLDATEEKARLLAALTRKVDASYKYFVMGNHDLWTHHGLLEDALMDAGVTHLRNRSAALPSPHAAIAIVGMDDPWTGKSDASAALEGAPPDRFPVFLCHSPDGLPQAIVALDARAGSLDRDVDGTRTRALFLCGHTHGGHVATPFGPIIVPGEVGKAHPQGFHRVQGVELCVSRGVGGIEVPIRTWARPEVVIIDLA